MIIFDLKCMPQGHVFEAWFASSEEYERQYAAGLVACPVCDASSIEKAPMAPRLASRTSESGGEKPVKAMLAEMAELQKKLLEKSDFVGDRFPDEARAIHLGESAARAIHGQASRADADSLIEDGIPVAPLPFPVRKPGEEN